MSIRVELIMALDCLIEEYCSLFKLSESKFNEKVKSELNLEDSQ